MSKESIRRAVRTWVIATLMLFIPGLLGWLNAVTEWARGQGSTPFPDAHGLAYLGVSAITAGFIAVGNIVWNSIEDASGKGFLRAVPPRNTPAANGQTSLGYIIVCVVMVLLVIWLISLLF